jgi:hypothetical protein
VWKIRPSGKPDAWNIDIVFWGGVAVRQVINTPSTTYAAVDAESIVMNIGPGNERERHGGKNRSILGRYDERTS